MTSGAQENCITACVFPTGDKGSWFIIDCIHCAPVTGIIPDGNIYMNFPINRFTNIRSRGVPTRFSLVGRSG